MTPRNQNALIDPQTLHPRPPFPRQSGQAAPGLTGALEPRPDHGKNSYVGAARLAGRKALITGADSGISRATAIAFAREGADIICPGPVWTPLQPSDRTLLDDLTEFGATTPLGRPAQPAELAPACVYFVSGESSYVTGETPGVTGGQHLA